MDSEEKTYLLPREAAEMYRVSVKTLTRWSQKGVLPCIVTPGGHRRYALEDLKRLTDSRNPWTPLEEE